LRGRTLSKARAHLDVASRAAPAAAQPSRALRRLEVFLDIAFGLVAVHMLSYLPPVHDMSWVGKPLGLLGPLVRNFREVWRALMGAGITVIAWYVASKRLNYVRATDFVHTTLVLVQAAILCFFIYFAICDPTLSGGPSSRALQCGSLALASVAGQLATSYARRRKLQDETAPQAQLDDIATRGRKETLIAVLNTPLSWVGPISWTLGWVVIPVVLTLAPRLWRAARRGPTG
jgi:hypothetical protein